MKFKPLTAALIAAGVMAAGTAGAIDLTPNWFKSKPAPAQGANSKTTVAESTSTPPAPVPMLSAGRPGNINEDDHRKLRRAFTWRKYPVRIVLLAPAANASIYPPADAILAQLRAAPAAPLMISNTLEAGDPLPENPPNNEQP